MKDSPDLIQRLLRIPFLGKLYQKEAAHKNQVMIDLLTKREIFYKLGEKREKIKEYGVKRIGLFGSYVRDEQKKESDVDLLVEFEEGKITFDHYMSLKFLLEDFLGAKVDLVIMEDLKPQLKPYILREVEYAKES